jgi:L-2-hydroxyglutarate oxidase
MAPSHDLTVVGGGIVGLATALTLLQRRPGADLVLLEKEGEVARHQSGHNSGVIHAGVYYAPGSLKARLCAAGSRWTREFCDQHAIPYQNTGKLIVATTPVELSRLAPLQDRAAANGLDVERIGATELRRREPHVCGLGALAVAATGIVDYRAVSRAMADEIARLGGTVRRGVEVTGIVESPGQVVLDTADGTGGEAVPGRVRTRRLVVCAGLQSDRLAGLAGLRGHGGPAADVAIVPFRGEYYRLPASRNGLIGSLIYPVPDPGLPFLGVHLTRTADGGVTVGPNAVLGFAREGYPKGSVSGRDVVDLLRFPGLWRVARRQLRTGLVEQWNSLSRHGYLGRVRRYCPELTVEDLLPEPAGIRAQAVRRDGTLVEDFMLVQTAACVHVLNAPSPAATSAMPIAAHIADRVLAPS